MLIYLFERPEGQRSVGKLMLEWETNILFDPMKYDGRVWI